MKIRPLHAIDYYKADHRRQYPRGTQAVYSNFTPRSTKHAPNIFGVDNKVVFFGLQYYIKYFLIEIFNREFFGQPKDKVVAEYKRRLDNSLGKDAVPVDHIGALHDLGFLPISIRALPEGVVVNEKVPMFTIENTMPEERPEFFWITNYLETSLSCFLWKPCTSATTARRFRIVFEDYARQTGADTDFDKGFIKWQGHDFSFRGMSGLQDAVMSGAGHLLSFGGTDTIPAIDFVEDYYGGDSDVELIGGSVPATEHSVMCMGSAEGEFETFKRLITEVYPKGIISIVSDTWDFWQVVTDFLPRLKKEIMARDGKVVIRPDSSPKTPVEIICGDPEAPEGSPERKGAIQCLWDTFGGTKTGLGYRQLDPHIGLIYGDSITLDRQVQILKNLKGNRFASTNVVLGIGSFTYEHVTRDMFGFAMKATAGIVNGRVLEIYKDPKTDSGMKKSARGFLAVMKNANGEYQAYDRVSKAVADNSELKEVFRDSKILVDHKFSDLRVRIEASVVEALRHSSMRV